VVGTFEILLRTANAYVCNQLALDTGAIAGHCVVHGKRLSSLKGVPVQILHQLGRLNPNSQKLKFVRIGRSIPISALTFLFILSTGSIALAQSSWSDLGKTKQATAAAGAKASAPECLQKAVEKLNNEGPEKALDMFRSCARDNANSPEAQQALGFVYFQAKQPKEAADALKQSLKLDPNNVQTRALLGKVYSHEPDKLDLAEELLKGVLETHPEMNDARMDLFLVYAQKKQVEKALAQFKRVLATESSYAVYHLYAAQLFNNMGLKEQAKKECERSLVLVPGFPPAKEFLKVLEQSNASGPAGSSQPEATEKK